MNRGIFCAILVAGFMATGLKADIVLDAADLNYTLKKMTQLKRAIDGGSEQRGEAMFQLGREGQLLAALLSRELAAHGWEQKALIDLALERTGALGVTIRYNPSTLGFRYDAKAFIEYLREQPTGQWAVQARTFLLDWVERFPLAGWDRLRKSKHALSEIKSGLLAAP